MSVEEPFVTEADGLQTKIIRGIHHMAVEGDAVRIFTYDLIPHPCGIERRVNGDLLFKKEELARMLGECSELLFKHAAGSIVKRVFEGMGLGEKVH